MRKLVAKCDWKDCSQEAVTNNHTEVPQGFVELVASFNSAHPVKFLLCGNHWGELCNSVPDMEDVQ